MEYKKICVGCGREMIRKKKSEAERKNWKFCSISCKGIHANKKRKLPELINKCLYCEKDFIVRTKRERGRMFCSKKCAITFMNKTEYHRLKAVRGERCWNWKGGVNKKVHRTPEFIEWRKKVFDRDNYTCQECGQVGGRLNAHHIKEVINYPSLIFDIDNGKTLCFSCHKKTHNWGIKAVWINRRMKKYN